MDLRTSQIEYAQADGTVKIEFKQDIDRDHEYTQQLSHFLHEKIGTSFVPTLRL